MIINAEEIVGYRLGTQQICCADCFKVAKNEEPDSSEDYITEDMVNDDDLYFCDICKQKI